MANESTDEIAHLEEVASILRRRLRILETQCVRFGSFVPDYITQERDDVQRQLAQVQTNLRRLRPSPTDTLCPYVGLLTFDETDSAYFFGRDELVSTLLQKAEHASFLAVLGPSGSGKSSVVRAGLIPALKGGAITGSDRWCYLILRPGARPLYALAATFAAVPGQTLGDIGTICETLYRKGDGLLLLADGVRVGHKGSRLVLVVDQAEELWTLAPTERETRTAFITEQQQPFIRSLLTAAASPDESVLIIFTMRADFLHRALEHHDLTHWMSGERNVLVSPLLSEELAQAITRPAELVECTFEPGLVDTLTKQTLGQPGALPLLEYTLLELWKQRQPPGILTWMAYTALGGIEGALAQTADKILEEYETKSKKGQRATTPTRTASPTAKRTPPKKDLDLLRAILLRLVQPGQNTADIGRRVPLQDLVPAGHSIQVVQALLQPLVGARLLTIGSDEQSWETVEIAHEALIRAWPTLQNWINEDRENLRRQIQLEEAAKEWERNPSPDYLWSGKRLADAQDWIHDVEPPLPEREKLFLQTSARHEERRQRSERSHYRGQAAGGAIGTGLGYGLAFALAIAFDDTNVSAGSAWNIVADTLIAFVFMFTIGGLVGLCLAIGLWLQRNTVKHRVATTGLTGALAGCLAYILFLVGPGRATPDLIGLKHVAVGALLGTGVGVGAGLTGSDRRLLGMTLGSVMAFELSGMLGGLPWSPLLLLIAGLVLGVSTALGFLIVTVEPDERMLSLYSRISAIFIRARPWLCALSSFLRSSDRTLK
jgi:hypothetical protein